MENSVANQLPEADSLPDGFVDSSEEPLTFSPPLTDQESQVTDYKEEKLIQVASRPDLIVDDFRSCECDNGNAGRTRTFPVKLSECASCDAHKLIKTPVDVCKDESDVGTLDLVSESVVRRSEHKVAPSADQKKHAGETCHIAEKRNIPLLEI
ncbi:hypothetical protein M8C21_022380 [Ambrosia artemisiifolia]|uniref:Uncharacterized protein n=1 Tax=Ambrosia artemisiifolia TaxID=4212 RepID=A0AAD5C7H4_AMBAR|nr:hypothetical protein M8C21_022380 [Ambrosia artemisiifolia]